MTNDLENRFRELTQSAKKTAHDAATYVQNTVSPPPAQSSFAKAASEALEYIREALKSGAEMASTAFNGAVDAGRGAIDNISSNTARSNNNDKNQGPKNTR